MESIIEQERHWEYVRDPATIQGLLGRKLTNARFYLKNSFPPARFQMAELRDGGPDFLCPQRIRLNRSITLYVTLNRQLEIDFNVVGVPAPGLVQLVPIQARISSQVRDHERHYFDEDDVVAANFQLIKSDIDFNRTNPQVAHRVINISESGVLLEIKEKEMMKHIHSQEHLVFDLIFRLQKPLRFQARVVHVKESGDSYLVGFELQGSVRGSAKSDSIQRLRSLINMTARKTR